MRSKIYDAVISRMTARWYAAVLERLPSGARVLDVGVGTGRALASNRDRVRAAGLRITGIDIDAAYVAAAQRAVRAAGLDDCVNVRLESVYDHRDGPYDAVYFSASFMLLPEPQAALRHVCELLAPAGRLYFTQTFESRRSPAMERVKPLLRFVTTIDFGRVTYESDFLATLDLGGVAVLECAHLGSQPGRSFKLFIAQCR